MFLTAISIFLILAILFWSGRSSSSDDMRKSLNLSSFESDRLRISVVVHNVQSVRYVASLLKSESTLYQVVVVVDFAKNQDLLIDLKHYFKLVKTTYEPNGEIAPNAIRALYRSHQKIFSKVVIVDSPSSHLYSPFQVGAAVSAYDYCLRIRSRKTLRTNAIESLLFELSTRQEESIERITSAIGERFELISREMALIQKSERGNILPPKSVKIKYRILTRL